MSKSNIQNGIKKIKALPKSRKKKDSFIKYSFKNDKAASGSDPSHSLITKIHYACGCQEGAPD